LEKRADGNCGERFGLGEFVDVVSVLGNLLKRGGAGELCGGGNLWVVFEGEFWRGCSFGRDLYLGIWANRETGVGSLFRGNFGGDVRWEEI